MKALVKMKTIRWCWVIGLFLFFLTAPVVEAQKATVIKIATLAPEGSSWIRTLKELNADVSEKPPQCVQDISQG